MIKKIASSLKLDTVDLFSTKREEKIFLDSVQDKLIKNISEQVRISFKELDIK